jgi:hypothetical protein
MCKYVLHTAVVAEYWLVTAMADKFTFDMPFVYVVNGSVPVVSLANAMPVTFGIMVAGAVMVKAPSTYPKFVPPLQVVTLHRAEPLTEFGIAFSHACGITKLCDVATPV